VTSEMLNCPFCGNEGETEEIDGVNCWGVGCTVCDYQIMRGPVGIGWFLSKRDAIAAWNSRAPEPATTKPDAMDGLEIEREAGYDRDYIPMPGGWEVQTKGRGSTFRLCDPNGDRLPIPDSPYLHETLTRMARDVNAAARATTQPDAKPPLLDLDADEPSDAMLDFIESVVNQNRIADEAIGDPEPERSGGVEKTVEDVPADRLIWCGIASQRPTRTKPLWVCVMDVFGLGSTFANQLCRKHGFDPDATSKKNRMLANGARPGEDES
jgi:hypothetical protein